MPLQRPAAVRGARRLLVPFTRPWMMPLVDIVALSAVLVATGRVTLPAALYVLLVVGWMLLTGTYRDRVTRSVHVDLPLLLGGVAVPSLVFEVIGATGTGTVLQVVPAAAGAVVVGRLVAYQLCGLARKAGRIKAPTLIVGAGVLGCRVAQALVEHGEYGMEPVGFLDGFPDDGTLPLPLLGDIDTFSEAVEEVGARKVIIAFGANREAEIVRVLRDAARADVDVHILPRLFELGVAPANLDTDMVWGFPLQQARRAALRAPAWRTKRIVDVVVGSLVLLLASPVLAAVALGVRVTSPGPIIFRQLRIGQRGEAVEIFKFRSMRVSSDSDTRWAGRADDRITSFGKFIRATSLDELPQLWNVVRGDMSMVGPRPERPHFARTFDQQVMGYRDRLRVPVGLTGWAQIHGLRGDTSIEERARFDNYYIEHWSLWFDIVILMRTATQVMSEVKAALSRKRTDAAGPA